MARSTESCASLSDDSSVMTLRWKKKGMGKGIGSDGVAGTFGGSRIWRRGPCSSASCSSSHQASQTNLSRCIYYVLLQNFDGGRFHAFQNDHVGGSEIANRDNVGSSSVPVHTHTHTHIYTECWSKRLFHYRLPVCRVVHQLAKLPN